MKYSVKIEHLPTKKFLIIPGTVILGDESESDTTDPGEIFRQMLSSRIADGSVERLKSAAHSDKAYILFCRTCQQVPGRNEWICGCDIACEMLTDNESSEFEHVTLATSAYVVFDCVTNAETNEAPSLEKINHIYWNEWLPNNPYISMIELETGANDPHIASVELYEPLDPAIKKERLTVWFPIQRKGDDDNG